jgi:hypothetical protein
MPTKSDRTHASAIAARGRTGESLGAESLGRTQNGGASELRGALGRALAPAGRERRSTPR